MSRRLFNTRYLYASTARHYVPKREHDNLTDLFFLSLYGTDENTQVVKNKVLWTFHRVSCDTRP